MTNGLIDRNGVYTLGAVGTPYSNNKKNGQDDHARDNKSTYSYGWRDGAEVAHVRHWPMVSQSTIYNTCYTYDGLGALASVQVNDGRPHTISYTDDLNGQVVRRAEVDRDYASERSNNPHIWSVAKVDTVIALR